MADEAAPVAIEADAVAPTRPGRGYPEPFASRVAGRVRRALGDHFGLTHFGVNLTRLPPGGMSALRHTHRGEDEFIYILEGAAILVPDKGEDRVASGHVRGVQGRLGQCSSPDQPH